MSQDSRVLSACARAPIGAFKGALAGAAATELLATAVRGSGAARATAIPTVKPAFAKDGTVTAANAIAISDGAATLAMTRATVVGERGMKAVVSLVAHAANTHAPTLFTAVAVPAIRMILDRAGWCVADADLFEISEALAVVAVMAARPPDMPADRLNVNGGVTALGHPIGASGPRHGDPARGLAGHGPKARCCHPVHLRRGSCRRHHRTDLTRNLHHVS